MEPCDLLEGLCALFLSLPAWKAILHTCILRCLCAVELLSKSHLIVYKYICNPLLYSVFPCWITTIAEQLYNINAVCLTLLQMMSAFTVFLPVPFRFLALARCKSRKRTTPTYGFM